MRCAVFVLVLLVATACGPGDFPGLNTYLLRSGEGDIQELAGRVLVALASSLETADMLQAGYPLIGHVATAPDPSDPQAERMTCDVTRSAGAGADCLLLNPAGDFATVAAITWQSAAFHTYRIYLLPRSPLARLDPARDYVAVDVFLMEEPGLCEAFGRAVRAAVGDLGARPLRR